ncbi:wall-associated receptor kinase 2-like protein [Cinnamomum micranthum f. kanehirae]|uniref:Wall-associated receptor kinase 2-like protein n=1 Tax=Cinnamomum micranthum f. kanehirae TaxID=337451 RepID=A0A443N2N6_9MAGN|nr:wall-associated receptor kinase 2-like protein [Cinnamomum micranthum f. kanehirae]
MRKLELVSIAWLLVLLQLAIANKVEGAGQAKPGCNDTCGNVTIKYPFGVGKDEKGHNCFLNKAFEVNCINGVPTLAKADVDKVFNISEIRFPNQVVLESNRIMAVDCTYTDHGNLKHNVSFDLASPFKVSAQANRFRAMGCDTKAYINNTGASFTSMCETQWMMISGKKKQGGLGQCQIAVPGGSSGYVYHVTDEFDYEKSACWRNCSYAVLADEEFEFSKDVIDSYLDKQSGVNTSIRFPLVAEWAIEDAGGVVLAATLGASSYSYGSWAQKKAVMKLTSKFLQELQNTGDLSSPDSPVDPDTYSDAGDPSSFDGDGGPDTNPDDPYTGDGGPDTNPEDPNLGDNYPKDFDQQDLKKAIKLYRKGRRIAIWANRCRVATAVLPGQAAVEVRKYTVQERDKLRDFVLGVRALSRIVIHANVARLLGISTRERSLIYRHFSDRTLHNSLHGSRSDRPSWEERLKIAGGTARGLAFAHSKGVYHGNVKSFNILLDARCNCKLVDFGVSRLWRKNTLWDSSKGYVDPYYMNSMTNKLTAAMDVYSFGVVLVELITGQDPSSKAFNQRRMALAMVFLSAVDEVRLEEVVDSSIWAEERKEQLLGVAEIAKGCLQKVEGRPGMLRVRDDLLKLASRGRSAQGGRPIIGAGGGRPVQSYDWQGKIENVQGQAQSFLDQYQKGTEESAPVPEEEENGGDLEYLE